MARRATPAAAAAAPAEADEDLIGGGSNEEKARPTVEVGTAAAKKLKGYLTRIEKLEGEKQGFVDDIKSIYKEIKDAGYDVKVVRKIVSDRKKDTAAREEFEQLLDLYRHALGMGPAPA